MTVRGHGGSGLSVMGAAMVATEMARVDGSISTFALVHGSLCALTIGQIQQVSIRLSRMLFDFTGPVGRGPDM